jgi:hypothetical protein
VGTLDVRLEEAILGALQARRGGASVCPSEAARLVDPAGWRARMGAARAAACRLVARGACEVTQGGRVVEPSTARGPIRIRLASSRAQRRR